MLRKIKIVSSFSGVLPTGSYANMRPGFEASMEFEQEFATQDEVNMVVDVAQQELQGICYTNFEREANKAKIMKIQEDRKDFHWYELENGDKVPSVTSILNFDTDFMMDESELKQYASQSIINHSRVEEYIKTGIWKDPKDMDGIAADMFILKSGNLQLDYDSCDFPEMLKKFPIKELKNGKQLINELHRYGGTSDGECVYEGIPTMFDIKRTPDKVKNFQQLAAYSKCKGMEHIKQMMIIILNDKTERGFSKPIISTDIDKYMELFLYKRKAFYKVYAI